MDIKIIKLFFWAILFTFCSCGKPNKPTANMDFGEVHPDKIIEKILTLDFNEEAQQDPNAFVEFVYLSKDGLPPAGIIFTNDGKDIKGNVLKLYAKDFVVNHTKKIGIRFPSGSKQQEYEGVLKLVDASQDLKQYITFGDSSSSFQVNDIIGNWKAEYNDPYPIWLKLAIGLVLIIIVAFGTFKYLKRMNGPMGPKSFKNGMISFLDGNTASVRLEDLTTYNISKALGIEEGIVLEPYDKPSPNGKKRFARLKNTSSATVKILYDGIEETIGISQDLYNSDVIQITNSENKTFTINYSNNKISRTF